MSSAAGAERPEPGRTWPVLLAALVVVLALAGGLLLGRGMGDDGSLVDDPVSIGFAQDMKVHHAQAVEMSAILHRRSPDPELSYLALDMLTTQQGQIGMMSGWLDLWGQTQTDRRPMMTWMDGHQGQMMGMASKEQVAALERLPVADMEEHFLRLMIHHHRGAVPMAAHAAERAESPELARLARGMERGQTAEIELMQSMLVARGHEREPAGAGGHAGHG